MTFYRDTFDQSQMNFQLRPGTKYKTYLGKYIRMSFWLMDKYSLNPIEPGNWVLFNSIK